MKQYCAKFAAFILCIAGLRAEEPQPLIVADAGFERHEDGAQTAWSFSCKEEKAQFEIVPVADEPGQTAGRIYVPGVRGIDPTWALYNAKPVPVEPNRSYILSYRVKASCETVLSLIADGYREKKCVARRLVSVRSFGPHSNWTLVQRDVICPEAVTELRLAFSGVAGADLLVDDVQIRPGALPPSPAPQPYNGSLGQRVQERMDRGLVAVPNGDGVYIGWRLLASDADDLSFNLYRLEQSDSLKRAGWFSWLRPGWRRNAVLLNPVPIRQTTDFVDMTGPHGEDTSYVLCEVRNGKETRAASCRVETCADGAGSYRAIPLQGVESIDRLGVADLDGDGRYDFVVKHPLGEVRLVDQYDTKTRNGAWTPSETTYKVEAYTQDGTRLWKNDLGWGVEHRNWFSPIIVYDLDGDGCAEVAVKIGEGDPRNERGRVDSGPEWLMVWDGRTGQELARAPWPARGGFSSWNLANRHQLAIAYLDGKMPCLIALRGTYGLMKVDAYEYRNRELRQLWSYSNLDRPREFWGQGAHFTQCFDADGDGRDEVLIGSVLLDDTGEPLWTTGKGHPDGLHAGDVDPRHPGLEIFYVIETRNQTGGLSLVDVATGEFLWKIDTPTTHCHTSGICADLDPRFPGRECYGADKKFIKEKGKEEIMATWFRTADGTDLPVPEGWGFGVPTVYWDADLQKEVMKGGKACKFGSTDGFPIPKTTPWTVVPMDILGDWREELLQLKDSELRIHVSTIPAMDRRVCLMQDSIYRLDIAMCAQAYPRSAMLSYDPAAISANLNLSFTKNDDGTVARIVLSAPLQHGVKGTCTLSGEGIGFVPPQFEVNLAAGQILEQTVRLDSDAFLAGPASVTARLEAGTDSLVVRREIGPPPLPRTYFAKQPHCEAEDFASQDGGDVHIRTAEEKSGISAGRCFSHWSGKGHSLGWQITVSEAGTYRPIFRYCCTNTAVRTLSVDDTPCPSQTFPASGGFGEHAEDWQTHGAVTDTGAPLLLELTPGPHTLRMTVPEKDRGLNLDVIALTPDKR